jgi:hypothetical protein
MLRAEVGQGMVIGRDPTAEPTVNVMVFAEFVQLPSATRAINGRAHTKGHENLGVDRIASRMPFHGGDPRIQRREVHLDHKKSPRPLHDNWERGTLSS